MFPISPFNYETVLQAIVHVDEVLHSKVKGGVDVALKYCETIGCRDVDWVLV